MAKLLCNCHAFSGGHVAGMERGREQKQTLVQSCSDPGTFWAGFLEAGVKVEVCVRCW